MTRTGLVLLLALGSCTYPIQMLDQTRPIGNNSIELLGEVRGESCARHILFVIPIDLNRGMRAAYNEAMKEIAGTDGLIAVTVDGRWIELGFYGQHCTIVRGTAFRFVR